MRLFKVLSLTMLCAAFAVPAASAQTAQPGLGGEQFTDNDPTITRCDAEGSAGTFTFEASGPATGPYPGTFSETGTVTVGFPDSSGRQRITAMTVNFAIDSPNGQVTGTKTFAETGDPGVNVPNARCETWFDGEIRGSIFVSNDDLRYEATIVTPERTCTADGPTSLSLVENSPVIADSFTETFYNDVTSPETSCDGDGGGGEEPPPPAAPTTKEQCRTEPGYEAYGFKNQGQCIAFVERGPKKSKKSKKQK